ncbi:MAG TPA: hypothetical protein VFM74_07040 [Candidatus Limnocylindria bacterium]|nr:hypothetical protein [Candidatus Limnocylindria bacterium]
MSVSSRLVSGAALLVALLIAGLIIGSLINLVTHAPRTAEAGAAASVGAAASKGAAASDVVVGQAGGSVETTVPSPPVGSQSITSTEAPTASPTPTPTAESTDRSSGSGEQAQADGFSAEVVVCRSIKDTHCSGQTDQISTKVRTIWIMVSFQNASSGDRIGMALSGPGGTRDGGSYAVKGGDGRAWARVAGDLSRGDYTVTGTRNGDVVAESTLHVD